MLVPRRYADRERSQEDAVTKNARSDERIVAGDHQFRIGGKVEELYAGAVHYWRLERDTLWIELSSSRLSGRGAGEHVSAA